MNSGSQGPPAVHRSPSANARVATAAAAVKRGRSSCRAAASSPSLLQRLAFGGSTLRVEFVRAGRPLCDRESGDVTATPDCPVLRAVCLRKRLSGRWLRAADQPAHSREPQPTVHGAVQVMFPPAVVWYVRQIGEPPGFWAAPWRPRATHMPRRPFLPRPVRAGWTPFVSVGALRHDARSHIFRRRGLKLDGPAHYGP